VAPPHHKLKPSISSGLLRDVDGFVFSLILEPDLWLPPLPQVETCPAQPEIQLLACSTLLSVTR